MMLERCVKFLTIAFMVVGLVISPCAGMAAGDDLEILREDIDEISERLDKVETRSILDKITLGGEFRTRMDYFQYKDTTAGGQEDDANTEDIWSTRFRINLKADVTDNIVFHGRLTYFKLWGDSNFTGMATDVNYPSIPDSEGKLHVERAYIEYFVPGTPLSFTVGRAPTSEGPPNEIRENTTRKGTWPKLLVDGEIDGLFANLSLDQWTGLKNSMFRAVYPKVYQNYAEYTGIELNDARGATYAFEMEVPGITNSMVWLSYTDITRAPSLTAVPASTGLTVESYPKDAGDFGIYMFHLQFNDIVKSGLDWFLSCGYTSIDPNSKGTRFNNGYEVSLFSDNLNGNLGDSRSGNAIYTGLRYKLPIRKLNHPSLGFEYNHGSKYWVGYFASGSGDLINKLTVAGDSYELYYIQPIDEKHMFLRLGAVRMDYDYENPMMLYGSMAESDMTITNVYLLMDVRF